MTCTTVPYNICVEQGADLSIPITVNGLILTGATGYKRSSNIAYSFYDIINR